MTGIPHHQFIELVLVRHHLIDEFAWGLSGSVGGTKNYGGNNTKARNHAPRRRECQRDGSAIKCGQGFGVGKRRSGDASDNKGMPCGTVHQSFPDRNSVLPKHKQLYPRSEVFPVLHAYIETKEALQQLWG